MQTAGVGQVCRKLGISEQKFYLWKKKFTGLGVSELRRLKQLEEENRWLKQISADGGYAGKFVRVGTRNLNNPNRNMS